MRGGRIRKGTQRGERKRAAVEAFLYAARMILTMIDTEETIGSDSDEGDDEINHRDRTRRIVADLGCGAGNLTVPLAWWLKQLGFGVLGVDINGQALALLSERADRLGISIETLEIDLLRLTSTNGDKDAGIDSAGNTIAGVSSLTPIKDTNHLSGCAAVVSLHACGAASDLSMAAAVENGLPFAISPCCIGKITTERSRSAGRMPPIALTSAERSAAPTVVKYPRSAWLTEGLTGMEDYKLLAAAADYGVGNSSTEEVDNQELARRRRCKLSKKIIEIDRLQWAKEQGYSIHLFEMPRIGPLYPKREILLGAKKGSRAALKLSKLPSAL